MLQITEAAEFVIQQIREQNDVPGSAALRIAPVETPGGGVGVGFAFTEGPEDGDQTVSEREGFRVYISPELADAFDNAALEANQSDEGFELELRTQADLHDHGHDHVHDHGNHQQPPT